MKSKLMSSALGSLLAIAAFAPYAAAPVGADGHEADTAAVVTRHPAMEEVVVYGKRPVMSSPEERLRADLREQMRALTESLKAELEVELEERIAPRLELAGADISAVVDLPPA